MRAPTPELGLMMVELLPYWREAPLADRPLSDIEMLMERLNLETTLLERRPDAVSGGELQRLSLLRVLLRRPAFIFADEPTSRPDPITQANVISLLSDLADRDNIAILLVSHDPALIRNTVAHELIM